VFPCFFATFDGVEALDSFQQICRRGSAVRRSCGFQCHRGIVWSFEPLSMRKHRSIYYTVFNGVTPLSHVQVKKSCSRACGQASSLGCALYSAHSGTRKWKELPTRLLMYMCMLIQFYSQHAFVGNCSAKLISYTLVRAFVHCQPPSLQSTSTQL
jgi:hypothetical protein